MAWKKQSFPSRVFLVGIYLFAIPTTLNAFLSSGSYSIPWLLLTLFSIPVAIVGVRLPGISSVISLADIFIFLALIYFGPGPALITYCLDVSASLISDTLRTFGVRGKIAWYRYLFNMSACSLSVCAMHNSSVFAKHLAPKIDSAQLLIPLLAMALSWFAVNTVTLSLAVSLRKRISFLIVWREGAQLYLLNFLGSAAAAGLIFSLYENLGIVVFSLSIPLILILYQIYSFHIAKYEEAQKHINELNKLYLQTIEAMASAVDAKSLHTRSHPSSTGLCRRTSTLHGYNR
jgi:hypothetical protein